jgi:hypothetical protein
MIDEADQSKILDATPRPKLVFVTWTVAITMSPDFDAGNDEHVGLALESAYPQVQESDGEITDVTEIPPDKLAEDLKCPECGIRPIAEGGVCKQCF